MAGASAQELLLIARQIGLPAGADSQEQVGARADQSSALCKQRGTKSFLTALASHHALAVTLRDMEAQSTSTSTTDIQELQALQKQLHVAVLNNQQVAQDHLSILNR